MIKNNNGFTLFEIVLVMAIVVVVTTIGIVNLASLQRGFRLRSSADEIKSLMQYGRELAIANKNRAIYNVNLSGNIFKLQADGYEMSRYQIPDGIALNPESLDWNFTPTTGILVDCSLCQIVLSAGDQLETINILPNGIVD